MGFNEINNVYKVNVLKEDIILKVDMSGLKRNEPILFTMMQDNLSYIFGDSEKQKNIKGVDVKSSTANSIVSLFEFYLSEDVLNNLNLVFSTSEKEAMSKYIYVEGGKKPISSNKAGEIYNLFVGEYDPLDDTGDRDLIEFYNNNKYDIND